MLKLSAENKILYGGPELPILGNGVHTLGEVLMKKLAKSNDCVAIVIFKLNSRKEMNSLIKMVYSVFNLRLMD